MLLLGSTKDLHTAIASHDHLFMSYQICCVGDGLWFLFDSYALLLYQTSLLNTTPLCGYRAARIPYSADSFPFRLERLTVAKGQKLTTLTSKRVTHSEKNVHHGVTSTCRVKNRM